MLDLLKFLLPWKEIGWKEIGETFYRFALLKTRWGNVYLHRVDAPAMHPHCHDHPWSFVAILLRGGYSEYSDMWPTGQMTGWRWQRPGSVLYRPAEWRHNVVTIGPSWSIIITTAKFRDWGFTETCRLEVP